ncbi:MAG: sigma-70 family RNA polymerase sigma factor [Lautropia sp.]
MSRSTVSESHLLHSIALDRLLPRLHRYCARMVGSALDGEDIVQDALLRAIEAAPPDRPIDNPEGWLFRIAHNLALDMLRRRSRMGTSEGEAALELIADPEDQLARREAAAATLPTFMHLPASQRSVVILFDVLDYSAEETSELLGTTVPAVKSLLQRGRRRLRELARRAPGADRLPALSSAERTLLQRYVDLFNARDFETLRAMLAADVRLDLVNRLKLQGPAVGEYFARYRQNQGWRAWAGRVEGQPAVLIQQGQRSDERPDYFVLLGWSADRVATIRDFLFARYVVVDAECGPL